MNLGRLALDIQPIVKRIKKTITRNYPDTRGLIIIGSFADSTYKRDSDLDIVWIKIRKMKIDRFIEFEEKLNSNIAIRKIQLVPFTYKEFSWHFNNFSTMAHSIQRGIAIYGIKNKTIKRFLSKRLSLPKNEWMGYWFRHWLEKYKFARYTIRRNKRFHKKLCNTECYCNIFDNIARVVVNFSILYLETLGIVPVSKKQIVQNLTKFHLPLDILKGLKLSLRLSGKGKYLTLGEVGTILPAALWFKKRLYKALKIDLLNPPTSRNITS